MRRVSTPRVVDDLELDEIGTGVTERMTGRPAAPFEDGAIPFVVIDEETARSHGEIVTVAAAREGTGLRAVAIAGEAECDGAIVRLGASGRDEQQAVG